MEAALEIIPAAKMPAMPDWRGIRNMPLVSALSRLKVGEGLVWSDAPTAPKHCRNRVAKWSEMIGFSLRTFIAYDGKRYIQRREETPQ